MNENLARRFEAVDSARSLRAACIEGGQLVLEAIRKGQLPELDSLKDLLESCDSSNPVLREFSLLQLWTVYSFERGPVGDDVIYEERGNGIFVGSTSKDIKARAWNFAAICRRDAKWNPATTETVNAFDLHCKLNPITKKYTHEDRAVAWKVAHPEDKRTIEQVKKASKNWQERRNRR